LWGLLKKTYTGVKIQILTPWSTVLLAKLTVPLAGQDITLFDGTRMFVIVFKTAVTNPQPNISLKSISISSSNLNPSTVGSRFAAVRFRTIHFYDPCRVGPSTPDLWCITVATHATFLYLVRF